MAVDQSVPLNPGTGGKNVRALELSVVLADGTLATVEMQVVSIADRDGNSLSFGTMATAELQAQQVALLRRLARAMERFVGLPSLEEET